MAAAQSTLGTCDEHQMKIEPKIVVFKTIQRSLNEFIAVVDCPCVPLGF